MSKCRVDGCNRSKELGPDGFCKVCVLASAMRGPSSSLSSGSTSSNQTPSSDPVNFPPLSTPQNFDFSKMEEMAEKINTGETVDQGELLKSVFGMVFSVAKTMGTVDQDRKDIRSNTERIKALEAKFGDEDEITVKLGLVILNLPHPPPGTSELEYARAVIKEVKALGVDPRVDVVKAVRLGAKPESSHGANDAKFGRVEIEVSNTDVKAKIMKTKNCLATHEVEILRKIRIHNKKTQEQQNQEYTNRQLLKMIPGGNAWYIAGNGQLRQQTRPGLPAPAHRDQRQQPQADLPRHPHPHPHPGVNYHTRFVQPPPQYPQSRPQYHQQQPLYAQPPGPNTSQSSSQSQNEPQFSFSNPPPTVLPAAAAAGGHQEQQQQQASDLHQAMDQSGTPAHGGVAGAAQ